MDDLICVELKEIINLEDIIKTDELYYKSKCRKVYNLMNIFYLLFFKRYLSL